MRKGFLKLPWETVSKMGYKGTGKIVAWVYANDNPEVKVRELAYLFDITHHAAHGILMDLYPSNRIKQNQTESNKIPNDNAGSQDDFKQNQTESNRIKQKGSLSICSKDKDKDKDNNNPFLRFWKAYPKTNGSRVGALKKWNVMKLPLDEGHVDRMVLAVEAQVAFKAHCDLIGEFCADFPYAEKWLGQERWENVPEIEKEITITNSKQVQTDYSRDYLAESNERINREDQSSDK